MALGGVHDIRLVTCTACGTPQFRYDLDPDWWPDDAVVLRCVRCQAHTPHTVAPGAPLAYPALEPTE